MRRNIAVLCTCLVLAGCESFSPIVSFSPPKVPAPTTAEYDSATDYIGYLDKSAGAYLRAASQYTDQAQVTDLAILGAAATAATAVTFGLSTDIIKIAGLSAAGAYSLRQYYGVDPRVTGLVDAANGVDCLRGLALQANNFDVWSSANFRINDGWRRIRKAVALSALSRRAPDYSQIVATMTAQAKVAAAFNTGDKKTQELLDALAAAADAPQKREFLAELPAKVTACVAIAG